MYSILFKLVSDLASLRNPREGLRDELINLFSRSLVLIIYYFSGVHSNRDIKWAILTVKLSWKVNFLEWYWFVYSLNSISLSDHTKNFYLKYHKTSKPWENGDLHFHNISPLPQNLKASNFGHWWHKLRGSNSPSCIFLWLCNQVTPSNKIEAVQLLFH